LAGKAERWHERLGTGGGPDLNGTAQLARARFVYEGEDQAVVPTRGWHLAAEGGYPFPAVGSANAPEVRGNAVWFHIFGDVNTVSLGASGASYFGRDIAQLFLNTLGSPFRLSASEIDEYRGTDDYLRRPMYLRRLFTLPASLGQGI
jgi:NTE family protein